MTSFPDCASGVCKRKCGRQLQSRNATIRQALELFVQAVAFIHNTLWAFSWNQDDYLLQCALVLL